MSVLEGKADFPVVSPGLRSLTRSGSCKRTFYIYSISHEACNRHSNEPLSHMVHLFVHLLRYLHSASACFNQVASILFENVPTDIDARLLLLRRQSTTTKGMLAMSWVARGS